ncbi:hypothetical protein [Nocardia spumae]|uniref:hypothetical protein n=1 Tax=Nocardia spumae TaxID=2887190 RepID=UPI001D142BEC|nr:hypothetical protein [Nocardia spumae]
MAESISDEMIEAFAMVAPVSEVPEQPARRYGGLITRLSFAPPAGLAAEEVADLACEIRRACAREVGDRNTSPPRRAEFAPDRSIDRTIHP